MRLEDIKTKEEAAYYLFKAQQVMTQAQRECQLLEQKVAELEQAERELAEAPAEDTKKKK